MSKQAIGVFDSGIGGISTLRELQRQLPREDFLYVADLAWSPYGDKSVEFLQNRAEIISEFFLRSNCKAIVIACNTATAAAIEMLRKTLSIPIIGVEPGIKPAIQTTITGVAGILATQRTIASSKFQDLLLQFSAAVEIIPQPCPGLADAIEGGEEYRPRRLELLRKYILPLLSRGADTLVLGCTHYPLIIEEIREVAGRDIKLIDTSAAIARQVVRQLEKNHTLNQQLAPGQTLFYSTDIAMAAAPEQRAEILGKLISLYWGDTVIVAQFPEQNESLSPQK